MKSSDIKIVEAQFRLLRIATRVPLKFGSETLTEVTCARVSLRIAARDGRTAEGWGETPLSVQWVWPSDLDYRLRYDVMITFLSRLIDAWNQFEEWGHPFEIGDVFQGDVLPKLLTDFNQDQPPNAQLPYLAALLCCSPIDIALHDAYGVLHDIPIYETYNSDFMTADLADYLSPAADSTFDFRDRFPSDFLRAQPLRTLPVWHLVGALDPLDAAELTGDEPADGYPILLGDWIDRDGLDCLKVKLRGNDATWDYNRLVRVGEIALPKNVNWLSADFNCTVHEPEYVNSVLDRLASEQQAIFNRILYIEQPFPYDLEKFSIDVRSVSERKPLFMDESAHDWRQVRLGRSLGWNGVALKTCKTQTGAILSLCWAQAHGMALMVQDLTNPMLAQIPHVLLAAHANTIMGVESNAMQFYPDASRTEANVHPGLYARRNGQLNLSSIGGSGFGYKLAEMQRLPADTSAELLRVEAHSY